MRSRDYVGLPARARRRKAGPGAAVIVQRRTADNRINMIAVFERILDPFQQDDGGSIAEDRPVGLGVKGAAPPGRRGHGAFLREIAAPLRQRD